MMHKEAETKTKPGTDNLHKMDQDTRHTPIDRDNSRQES